MKLRQQDKWAWIQTSLIMFSLFSFLFGTVILHEVLNSNAETFYFFWCALSRTTVFDLALIFEGISFFLPTALVIYSLLKGRASITVISSIILVSFLVIWFLMLNMSI